MRQLLERLDAQYARQTALVERLAAYPANDQSIARYRREASKLAAIAERRNSVRGMVIRESLAR